MPPPNTRCSASLRAAPRSRCGPETVWLMPSWATPGRPVWEPRSPAPQRVLQELRAADLSVHLLDALPGREIENREGSTYPQRQVELALQHGKSQLIWVPRSMHYDAI